MAWQRCNVLSTSRMVADCGAAEEKSSGRRSSGLWAPAAEGRRVVGMLSLALKWPLTSSRDALLGHHSCLLE